MAKRKAAVSIKKCVACGCCMKLCNVFSNAVEHLSGVRRAERFKYSGNSAVDL